MQQCVNTADKIILVNKLFFIFLNGGSVDGKNIVLNFVAELGLQVAQLLL